MTSPHFIVAGTRRAWTSGEKQAILAEARETASSVSAVARRHGLHASLLFRWRRDAREQDQAAAEGSQSSAGSVVQPTFVQLSLPAPGGGPSHEPRSGAIEIEVAGGHRVRVEPGADPAMLRGVLLALLGR